MNWQRHQLWNEKLGKTVQVEQPKVAKVQITGKPCNSSTVKMEVKPVKLLLKNYMNIGSEAAAGNSAFIFSLIESCKLNDIDLQDYLKRLFECILHGKNCKLPKLAY